MKQALLILCVIYPAFFILNAQEKEKENSFVISDQVNINNEVLPFSNYFSEYRLNDNWVVRAENIETNFGGFGESYRIKEFPLLAKYSFTEKFSVLFGSTTNLLLKNGTVEDVSASGTLGVQYDFTESFLMEARFNYNLSNDSPFKQSLPSTNSLFKLGAKYKF
ncbi:outer membrane protein [Algibacter sp. L4_22]|uniref:outer membrane protein n=1 Tax=Algibacter sp. L4_22 TaxID=2942477 RepID=UPI00201B6AE7|nr:PorT family protein [Algibacter sp. L4_22]MCL5129124.1 PorT family protein [Algibacter sp. L4_22]